MNPTLADKVARAPKAELHIHIEGSLEPELIFALAQRNGVALAYDSIEALRAAYAFTDLQSFLDIYYAGASVLLHERDFHDMTMAYVERALADNVTHTEIFFDPQTHTERGVSIATAVAGIESALAEGERRGLTSKLDPVLSAPLAGRRRAQNVRRSAAALRSVPAPSDWRGAGFIGERTSAVEVRTRLREGPRQRTEAGRARGRGRTARVRVRSARRAEGRSRGSWRAQRGRRACWWRASPTNALR